MSQRATAFGYRFQPVPQSHSGHPATLATAGLLPAGWCRPCLVVFAFSMAAASLPAAAGQGANMPAPGPDQALVADGPTDPVRDSSGAGPASATSHGAPMLNLKEMLAAGGMIGYAIVFLSFLLVALIVDNLLNVRRTVFMPPGLAEEVHRCLIERRLDEARKLCDQMPGFLSRVLAAGLEELPAGYVMAEKAMEDAAAAQSARNFRRAEYLAVISALAPMLGLMGTVWGMIVAFMEFEAKANPQISELAPGVYKALVTTLQGLAVAIPAVGALAWFRSRIEELSAESVQLATHVFADVRRAAGTRKRSNAGSQAGES